MQQLLLLLHRAQLLPLLLPPNAKRSSFATATKVISTTTRCTILAGLLPLLLLLRLLHRRSSLRPFFWSDPPAARQVWFTHAVMRVTRESLKSVATLEGHRETCLPSVRKRLRVTDWLSWHSRAEWLPPLLLLLPLHPPPSNSANLLPWALPLSRARLLPLPLLRKVPLRPKK